MSEETKKGWPCVMLDIETLATTDDAVILEIGAVMFDRKRRIVGEAFGVKLDYLDQPGRRADVDTVMWWTAPERIARFREMQEGHERRPGLWHGLCELDEFVRARLAPAGEVWAKGDFDLRILGHAMRESAMVIPWEYYQARELRTVMKWTKVDAAAPAPHNAMHDALLQVHALFAAETWRIPARGPDHEAGWAAYRAELAETRGMLLPAWAALHGDVREAWCAGLAAALHGIPKPEGEAA